jgi:1,4-dihydroxy-2-naphthoyl-CoA hydrolase
MITVENLNERGVGRWPAHLGLVITSVTPTSIVAQFAVKPHHMAPNGFLHAGAVVTLADTACGYGCYAYLPEGASGFTTVKLKSNHLGTAREGTIECVATAAHRGKSTQVWDAVAMSSTVGGASSGMYILRLAAIHSGGSFAMSPTNRGSIAFVVPSLGVVSGATTLTRM